MESRYFSKEVIERVNSICGKKLTPKRAGLIKDEKFQPKVYGYMQIRPSEYHKAEPGDLLIVSRSESWNDDMVYIGDDGFKKFLEDWEVEDAA